LRREPVSTSRHVLDELVVGSFTCVPSAAR
jgi:hypothetical protein